MYRSGLDSLSVTNFMLGDISFPHCLVDFIHFGYYTSHRGCLVNCDGLPPISKEWRRTSVTKYEKSRLLATNFGRACNTSYGDGRSVALRPCLFKYTRLWPFWQLFIPFLNKSQISRISKKNPVKLDLTGFLHINKGF